MGKAKPTITAELDRFGFAISPACKRLIRLAARKLGTTMGQFCRDAAVARAKQVLAAAS
jgi:uncharacterized protein (DUF1778 family)